MPQRQRCKGAIGDKSQSAAIGAVEMDHRITIVATAVRPATGGTYAVAKRRDSGCKPKSNLRRVPTYPIPGRHNESGCVRLIWKLEEADRIEIRPVHCQAAHATSQIRPKGGPVRAIPFGDVGGGNTTRLKESACGVEILAID